MTGDLTPRVSVVVPSFNNVSFIEATMDSILAQTFEDFELIVADHSSVDGTWELLQRYLPDPRVRLLRTEAGGGAPRNWERVTAAARGELLKLVCGDDIIYPDCLRRQVEAMDANPSVVLVAAQRDLIDARGALLLSRRGLAGLTGLVAGRMAARHTVVAGSNIFGEPACVLFRRETLQDAGGWDARTPYVIDEATYVNVLLRGDFVGIDTSLAAFRLSSTQWSVHLAREQSGQVIGFHHRLADDVSGLLSRTDLLRGDARARGMAYARRLAYLWVGRRMHTDAPPTGTPPTGAPHTEAP
ncbi:MAG TPA: glycosyltransferase family A protein [Dermatophilaceae bacterium]|nr:glycosyltransferase family A protein [Dermatophilaceae bacterium]